MSNRIMTLKMSRLSFRLIIFMIVIASAVGSCKNWTSGFDDLSDYSMIKSLLTNSDINCIVGLNAVANVHLATFNSSTGVCTAFRCRMGLSHCRKCRNANQGNQLVWLPNPSCWITVQHRVSDSVDFYRNWSDYKAGFGEGPNGNFWIGLEMLYNLTYTKVRQLRFLMTPWNGTQSWAQYSVFSVGPESTNYTLSVSGFSGSPGIGDSFTHHSNYGFTTRDKDHDKSDTNCATMFHGAWWYSTCFLTHPNGKYWNFPAALNSSYAQGIHWMSPFGYYYSLKEIELLVF